MKTFQAISAVVFGILVATQAVAVPAPLEDDQSLGTPTRLVIIYPGGNGGQVTRTVILEPTQPSEPKPTTTPKWPWYPKPTTTTTKTTAKPVITKAPEPTPSDIFIPIRTITLE